MSIADLAAYKLKIESPNQRLLVTKNSLTTVAGRNYSLWNIAPLAGATPTTAVVPDRTTAGAMGQFNGGALSLRVIQQILGQANKGCLVLCDRLGHQAGLSGTVTTAQSTNLPTAALTRYTTGDGVFACLEIYCVDDQTECLTHRGWTSCHALRKGDLILAFDMATNTTRWEPVKDVYLNDKFCGEMIEMCGQGKNGQGTHQGFSALTTRNHRWPVEIEHGRAKKLKLETWTSETLPKSHGRLLCSAKHEFPERPVWSDALVRLVAWYVTEGYFEKAKLIISQSHLVNKANCDSIRADLIAIGAKPSDKKKRGAKRRPGLHWSEGLSKSECINFVITGTAIEIISDRAPGRDKVPSMDFLRDLTQSQMRDFIDVLIRGDGTRGTNQFSQWHTARMDMVMAACVLAGYSPSIRKQGKGGDCTIRGFGNDVDIRRHLHRILRKTRKFKGTVWCPVTTSGYWVARRNGSVHITGNTQIGTTATTVTTSYTNQAGTAGQASQATVFGGTAFREVNRAIILPLAQGDTGVRAVASVTVLATTGTAGNFGVTLYKPLMIFPIQAANVFSAFDPLLSMCGNMPEIIDDAALYWMYIAETTASGIFTAAVSFEED